jgi:hypothetical protein
MHRCGWSGVQIACVTWQIALLWMAVMTVHDPEKKRKIKMGDSDCQLEMNDIMTHLNIEEMRSVHCPDRFVF